MTNFDHYAAARTLISHLEHAGLASEAAALVAAMEDGATGTEIFMALRFHLSEILNRAHLPVDARKLASRLMNELDDTLQ